MRPRLTYANVISTVIVALLLAGGTAFAANQLAKKSVGAKQLKANAVTTAKIREEAVTAAKIRAAAVDGSKILDGSVTGADINGPSTPFSQVIARARSTTQALFTESTGYALGNATYTQNAGEDNLFIGSLDVNFAASCTQPREAVALLLLDVPDPSKITEVSQVVGFGKVEDEGTGSVSKSIDFSPFPGGGPMGKFATSTTATHTLSVLLGNSKCKTGSGVTVTGAGVDVLGVK